MNPLTTRVTVKSCCGNVIDLSYLIDLRFVPGNRPVLWLWLLRQQNKDDKRLEHQGHIVQYTIERSHISALGYKDLIHH